MIGSASSGYLTPNLPQIIPPPPIVAPDTSLYQAITRMNATASQCVLVARETGIIGILLQSDIIRFMTTELNLEKIPVSQIMCAPVTMISLEQAQVIDVVLNLLNSQFVKVLPVVDDQHQVVGLITPETLCQQLQSREDLPKHLQGTPIHPLMAATDIVQQTMSHPLYQESTDEKGTSEEGISEEGISGIQKACEVLSVLLNHSPLAVVEWDNHFRVRGWSSQAERLFGWQAATVLNKDSEEWQFIYEADREKHREMIARLLSGCDRQESYSYRNYTRQGEVIHCDWYYSTLVDAAGKLVSVLSFAFDVTQQKQAEERLKQQLAAIETSIDGIAILDVNGCYTYLNQAHTMMLGYDHASQLLGKSWQDIYSEDVAQPLGKTMLQMVAKQGYWRGEVVGKKRDGSLLPQEIALTRLDNGGFTCICRDHTARKLFEAELLRSRAELETRIEERTEELCNTNTYLQAEIVKREKLTRELAQAKLEILHALEQEKELNELKSRFITNTSHEFRTPLTVILGSLELLEYSSDNWSLEKKKKHYQRMRASIQHMTQLLDDVLTINQTEPSASLIYTPSFVNLYTFCQKLVDEIRCRISSQHTIHLICDETLFLAELDEKLLWHILNNLLVNAIKYSPNGGVITLEVYPNSIGVVLQVRDQGIGIPKADLPRLFEPFHRASNVKTIPGNGLGLTIVKQSVDLHGGEITLNSEVGVGTVFTVSLPASVMYQQPVSM